MADLATTGIFALFATEGAKAAAKSTPWILRWVVRFFRRRRIVVTGMAGVGKTVLAERMADGAPLHYVAPRTSQGIEKHRRTGSRRPIDVWTVPGQDAPPRHEADRKLERNGYHGLIHAVSFGFPTLRDQTAINTLIAQGVSTVEDFRQRNLELELADLRRTLDHVRRSIRNSKRPCWLIVALTKVDLYADRAQEAATYYGRNGTGRFVDTMNEFMAQVGSDRFQWSTVPVCAVIEDFQWNGVTTRSQLTELQRNEVLSMFCSILDDYCA